MTKDTTASTTRPPLVFERSYEAAIEDLWALWTTKEGFESWWGPEGFRVEVHALDARVSGELHYDMIATGPEQVAFMERAGRPLSHAVHSTFVEVAPPGRLTLRSLIDFIPGVEPYENDVQVELVSEGAGVRMLITVDPHHDEEMTRLASMGWESQLRKLPAALAARSE
jgi:uncharacterized protein YndB with AHSA1/START domain